MKLSWGGRPSRILWLATLTSVASLPVGCGDEVSREDLDEARGELRETRVALGLLERQVEEMQAEALAAKLARVGEVLTVDTILEFPAAIVELRHDSATLATVTKIPTICTVTVGPTTAYGRLSTDENMMPEGHKEHRHVLRGLEPNTEYHYKWRLVAPDGTVYSSKDHTFRTLPSGRQP